MSLFHTIKYPISAPPTVEQLEALPKELFKKWAKNCGWVIGEGVYMRGTDYICRFYSMYETEASLKDIIRLRKMIQEYEE
jgi:hypothetical protein